MSKHERGGNQMQYVSLDPSFWRFLNVKRTLEGNFNMDYILDNIESVIRKNVLSVNRMK